jgi:FAD/FMN-containing dehydrogenase
LAREAGLELAVRSGGHSLAGHGVSEGGVVIDLSDMRALQVDAEKRFAWAQTGLTAGEYTAAADAYGLATGFGDTGSVGISEGSRWEAESGSLSASMASPLITFLPRMS